jgi:hypothetical protein
MFNIEQVNDASVQIRLSEYTFRIVFRQRIGRVLVIAHKISSIGGKIILSNDVEMELLQTNQDELTIYVYNRKYHRIQNRKHIVFSIDEPFEQIMTKINYLLSRMTGIDGVRVSDIIFPMYERSRQIEHVNLSHVGERGLLLDGITYNSCTLENGNSVYRSVELLVKYSQRDLHSQVMQELVFMAHHEIHDIDFVKDNTGGRIDPDNDYAISDIPDEFIRVMSNHVCFFNPCRTSLHVPKRNTQVAIERIQYSAINYLNAIYI